MARGLRGEVDVLVLGYGLGLWHVSGLMLGWLGANSNPPDGIDPGCSEEACSGVESLGSRPAAEERLGSVLLLVAPASLRSIPRLATTPALQ